MSRNRSLLASIISSATGFAVASAMLITGGAAEASKGNKPGLYPTPMYGIKPAPIKPKPVTPKYGIKPAPITPKYGIKPKPPITPKYGIKPAPPVVTPLYGIKALVIK